MNRFLFTDRGGLEKGLVDLWLVLTAGTSGAIPSLTATSSRANGISSVVLDSTGVVSVHLQDNFAGLEAVDGTIAQATFSNTTASLVALGAPSTEDCGSATDPKVVFNLFASGAAGVRVLANMAAGDVLRIHMVFRKLVD